MNPPSSTPPAPVVPVCPTCKGAFIVIREDDSPRGFQPETCPDCNGTGTAKAVVPPETPLTPEAIAKQLDILICTEPDNIRLLCKSLHIIGTDRGRSGDKTVEQDFLCAIAYILSLEARALAAERERDEARKEVANERAELEQLFHSVNMGLPDSGLTCKQLVEHFCERCGESWKAKLTTAEAERDAAVKEAARRDEKWKSGIEDECGRKINFDPIGDSCSPNPTLGEFVSRLTAKLAEARADKERLDWLEKQNVSTIYFDGDEDDESDSEHVINVSNSLRAAIDAASKPTP